MAPHDLAAGGFGIKFTSGGDVNYGYADFNGVHFDESTVKVYQMAKHLQLQILQAQEMAIRSRLILFPPV